MIKGTVLYWNISRGWGFVSSEGFGEVFVHHAALDPPTDDLRCGQEIEFDLVAGTVGSAAANVRYLR